MARVSPIRNLHRDAEARFLVYGDHPPIEMVASYAPFELEYAAVRRGAGLIDQPQRAVIALTGPDRTDFLNRMLTQELKSLAPWSSARSFWLNRTGRIEADLRVIHTPERTLLDVDAHSLDRTLSTLDSYLITEDAQMRSIAEETHRFALHGPCAPELLGSLCKAGDGPTPAALADGQACEVRIGGVGVLIDRQDALGAPGYELHMATEGALEVWLALIGAGRPADTDAPSSFRHRAIGWAAFNTARIEAGWPLFHVDFGPDSRPAETGVLHDRVSFKKGCYLGQEIVARMDSRKAVKRCLTAIKFDAGAPDRGTIAQPITGEPVYDGGAPEGASIGAVTSSALSPMLGETPICFAMLSSALAEPGQRVLVGAEGARLSGATQESLRFLKEPFAV